MKLLEVTNAGDLKLKNRLVFPAYETNWATEEGREGYIASSVVLRDNLRNGKAWQKACMPDIV